MTSESASRSDAAKQMWDLIRRMDPDSTDVAERRLAELDVVGLLESCVDPANQPFIDSIGADSYLHANGFFRISFPEFSASPVRIRLHIWPETSAGKAKYDESDAHNHKWPFASRVLAGSLTHQIFSVTASAGPYEHFKHLDLGDRYALSRAGQASLELRHVEMTTAGTVYEMTPEKVHRVIPQAGYSATLVAELQRISDVTDVFARASRHSGGPVERRRLDVAEIYEELARAIEALRRRAAGECKS